MYNIHCKDGKEFVDLQLLLLSQGYVWKDSGKKIIHEHENFKNIVVSLDKENKILRYTIPGMIHGEQSYDVSYVTYIKQCENVDMKNFVNDIFEGDF